MQQINFNTVFQNSFETFKAFENLDVNQTGNTPANAPKSIWQILNHLIAWQGHHLSLIKNVGLVISIDEAATWISAGNAATQGELNNSVSLFKKQLSQLKSETEKWKIDDKRIVRKFKLVQDVSMHLSFHLGEVILMRRIEGTYSLPHEMNAFLS